MSDYMLPYDNDAITRRRLRLGTADPQCAKCKSKELGALCVISKGDGSMLILCRTCKAERTPISVKARKQKARRFEEAGYFKPACVVCHDPNLQILELDHLAGAANSALIEPLCANHHGIKSFLAESGLMASLRLRDPERSALLLQAAFEFGAGALLGMFAVGDGAREETARAIIFGVLSLALFAWAAWNLKADAHLEKVLGRGYDHAIAAEIPR
jgi:hypothetical protein